MVHRLDVEFHPGLNLLTGETGAGKSIIVDALSLLLGSRGTSEAVRTNERAAIVAGYFEPEAEVEQQIDAILTEVGIEEGITEGLTIRREVNANGRSRTFINDRNMTTATLKSLQPFLVEIHGQGEQQTLASTRFHVDILDNFAACTAFRREVASAFANRKEILEDIQTLRHSAAEAERLASFLQYQLTEIETAALHPGEDVELSAERTLLGHAEKALALSGAAYAELYESDHSVLTSLASVRRRVQQLSEIDPRLIQTLEVLEAATIVLTDIAETLRGHGANIDFSPARLGEIEDRLSQLEKLKRKYGKDLQEILRFKEDLKTQLCEVENVEDRERVLQVRLTAAEQGYISVAKRLTEDRRAAAKRLEERVMEELHQVAMERAQFKVDVKTAKLIGDENNPAGEDPTFWSPQGADRVEFLLSANPGESLRPLARIASGGELSRVMLALRTVCAGGQGPGERSGNATLVFDEVDAGIGGRVAEAVGRRLKALAAGGQQILCVTHQAQIARFADHHYAVSKNLDGERTVTMVKELSREERVSELARMIGGAEMAATTQQTARWLLENSGSSKGENASAPRKARRR
ncbi:MAG: DNA repair protein RecN [Pyrinomonadaceae bacterium]|nr:DNA repair protein RecN [Pyrinomonadaceae bacterium]